MTSNYITIYSLDQSKVFTIYYEGYYNADMSKNEIDLKDYIVSGGNFIDIFINGQIKQYIHYINPHKDRFYTRDNNSYSASEEYFWLTWNAYKFKLDLENLLVSEE